MRRRRPEVGIAVSGDADVAGVAGEGRASNVSHRFPQRGGSGAFVEQDGEAQPWNLEAANQAVGSDGGDGSGAGRLVWRAGQQAGQLAAFPHLVKPCAAQYPRAIPKSGGAHGEKNILATPEDGLHGAARPEPGLCDAGK